MRGFLTNLIGITEVDAWANEISVFFAYNFPEWEPTVLEHYIIYKNPSLECNYVFSQSIFLRRYSSVFVSNSTNSIFNSLCESQKQ